MATTLPRIVTGFTLDEVRDATGAAVRNTLHTTFHGVSTDTRAIEPGMLFVALQGERFDGHAHLGAALSRGAAGLVVRDGARDVPDGVTVFAVPDTLRALGDLARAHQRRVRARRAVPTVAVSGAVGKTTTKELVAAALRAVFGETLSTRGNLNNLVGAPLTLLSLDDTHRAAVVECGSNAPGEIARIAAMIEPDVAMVMNADAAHTEGLGTIEAVADEEGSLFGYARSAVVGNADEPLSCARTALAKPGVARWKFGVSPDADVRVAHRARGADGVATVTFALSSALRPTLREVTVRTRLLGPAVATNLAGALAAVAALGVTDDQLVAAARALGDVPAVHGRLCLRRYGALTVIDDTYNASPRAMRAALDALAEVEPDASRRVVVLGDMRELGALSEDAHREVGAAVAALGVARFVAVGQEMVVAADEAARRGVRVERVADSAAAATGLRGAVRDGTSVLVKGSRGMLMERCVAALEG